MERLSVRALHELQQKGEPLYLVDVRQPWEHELVHLAGDVLVPLDQLVDRAHELAPPAGALVVAYCHHGIRVAQRRRAADAAGARAASPRSTVASIAGRKRSIRRCRAIDGLHF